MMMGGAMQRHRGAMMGGIPAAYGRLRNPLPRDPEIIAAGRALYRTHCAACHGEQGLGDGPAAAALSPPPANLRWVLSRPMAGDGYLMWAISEGGTALGTPMPAFKDALSEADRWKIIRFLRTL
jgi:mono/diheme cytochrome c family protein